MINIGRLFLGLVFMVFLIACADQGNVKEGVYRGMYQGATQIQETQRIDDPPVVENSSLSYDDYQRERQALRSDGKRE